MILGKIILYTYKKILINRNDYQGALNYFSHADFDGLGAKKVEFSTANGDVLRGNTYSYSGAKAGKLVVFDHGIGAGHRAYMREIERICRAGYTVLSYDKTGSGESDGESIRSFSQGVYDLEACLGFVAESEFADDEIILVGHSRGAFSALNARHFGLNVTHIVAMSAPLSLENMLSQFFGGFLAKYIPKILKFEEKAVEKCKNAYPEKPEKPEKGSPKFLIIHSRDDKMVGFEQNFEMLRAQKQGCPEYKFVAVDGRGHNPNYSDRATAALTKMQNDLQGIQKSRALKSKKAQDAFRDSYDWWLITEQDEALWEQIFAFFEG